MHVRLYIKWTQRQRASRTFDQQEKSTDAISRMEMDGIINQLESLPRETAVRHRPTGGTTYVFQWEEEKNIGEISSKMFFIPYLIHNFLNVPTVR